MTRRKRLRLRGYDYTATGAYFVTVCAWEKRCLFGEREDDGVVLNALGRLVEDTLEEMSNIHPGVAIDVAVVMPNHVHAIVMLDRIRRPPPLPAVVGTFKGRASRRAGAPLWQRGFHDRIVRSEAELAQLREYVLGNPLRWAADRENTPGDRTRRPRAG